MVEEWFLALAASPWVYLAVFAFVTVDGFFPPVPSESVVIALAAVAIATGQPDIWLVLAIAAAGAFAGDQIAYAIGRRVPVRTTRLLRGKHAQRTVDWAEHALAHRGAAFIFGARYIPIGRVAVNMSAGALGYPRGRYVGLTALAAVSWAVYSTAIGIGAGAWLHDRPLAAAAVGVVMGVLIGVVVDWGLGRIQGRPWLRRSHRTTATPAPTSVRAPAPAVGDVVGRGAAGPDVERVEVVPAAAAPVLLEPAAAMVLPRAERP